MEGFFIEYRDPLFGVLLFLLTLFFISIASYVWGSYSTQRRESAIRAFAKRFEHIGLDQESSWLLSGEEEPIEKLLFLAEVHQKSGEHEKAVKIYLTILDSLKNPARKQEVLERLGRAYFKAGFLQRAQEVFLQILRHYPRNPAVLTQLMYVHESMSNYSQALEVLESLEELESNPKTRHYLECKIMLSDLLVPDAEKNAMLLELWRKVPALKRLVFAHWAKQAPEWLWKHLDSDSVDVVFDILWTLPASKLDFDTIAASLRLQEIYAARGDVPIVPHSKRFELECLLALRAAGSDRGELGFEYLCTQCGSLYPVSFERCPCCMELLEISVIPVLAERHSEENRSLL